MAASQPGSGHPFRAFERVEDLGQGVPDELITTSVDGDLTAKLAAMRAHATQVSVAGTVFALADGIGKQAYGTEHFRLVRGTRGPGDRETDLFAGLV